jgi:Domain of unknown function (DUF1772)
MLQWTVIPDFCRIMIYLQWTNLVLAFVATLPPLAHLLELPNKVGLDGPTWLAVQQHLYRGWGPLLGAPAEIGALATTLVLLIVRRTNGKTRRLMFVAVLSYAAMIATFFVLNAPVNEALARWTPASLPDDWQSYRARWETGHAIAALLSLVGLGALVRARFIEALTSWQDVV